MSTKHSKAAEKFLQDSKMAAWHNETLWMVRAKRDKMSKEVPEWEELRNKACELKLYSNSHLEELLLEFEKNATANGAIVHWAKDADEYCAIVYEILNEHNVHHFIKSKSMLAEECGLNPFLMERGIDVVESDLGERILQLMHLEPSHIVLPAIHIKREQVGELFEKEMGTEKGNFDPTYLTHAARKNLRHLFLNADEVIKSPGIPNDAPLILKLKAQGTPVISEIEFAGRYTNAKMICITGSNGKTTTTSLIYHIFKSAGMNVGLAGNIGKSLALQVAEDHHDYYIIELSSFQLDNMYNFRANIAVLMNITPDHLDRYDHCMQNYIDAKFRITQNQTPDDAFIFWNDDPIIKRELAKHGLKAHLYPFAAVKEDGAIAYVEDHEVKINEPIAFNMEQEELALTGQHNLYNSLAAGISANLAGITKENIRKALSDFKGVEHRLEKVARVRGIDFINDSKATNVNSCWYALQSMTTKTVLILGGKDKGNDYTEIEDLVREKCSALVYMGLHNEKLHDFFDRFGLPVADVQTGMKDAVEAAYKLAKKGETVLLSPCCASFDLFKSYEDRGEQFKECVRAL